MLIKHFIPLFFAFLFFGNTALAQADKNTDEQLNTLLAKAGAHLYTKMDSALFYLNQITKITAEHENWNSYLSACLWKTNCAGHHYRFDSMYVYLSDAEEMIKRQNINLDTMEYGGETRLGLDTNWGNYYYKTGNFDKASTYFKAIIETLSERDTLGKYEYQTIISNYLYLGNIEKARSNYKAALDHFLYCEQVDKEMRDKFGKGYAMSLIYSSLAGTYKALGDYDNARIQHQKAIGLSNEQLRSKEKSLAKLKNGLITHYNQFARLYIEEGDVENARDLLNTSLKYHIENDPFYPKTNMLMGRTYALEGKAEKAMVYMKDALEQTRKRYGAQHYRVAEDLLQIGDVFYKEKDYGKALIHYHDALASITENYDTARFAKAMGLNPSLLRNERIYSLPQIENTIHKKTVLLALSSKANALFELYQSDKNMQNLEAAEGHIQLAVQVMDEMRLEYHSEEARQFLVEQSYPVFEKAIEINRQLYQQKSDKNYLAKAFEYAEKSKGLLLLDALKSTAARQFANIPEATLEAERLLRFNMNHLREKIGKLKKETKNEARLRKLQNDLFEQTNQYEIFIAKLEKMHPDYYQAKYDKQTMSIDDIRRDVLDENMAFVEYFMGDSQVYAFLITKDDIQLESSPKVAEIQTAIAGLREAIVLKKDDQAYLSNARLLYRHLLENILDTKTNNIKRLIIVPDGGLAYIPFDILLEKELSEEQIATVNYRRDAMPYLLNRYAISYAYSGAVLRQNLNTKPNRRPSVAFGGFAPSFDHLPDLGLAMRSCASGRLSPLKHNQKEVENIANTMGGKAFVGESAGKADFEEKSSKCRILHLATHACADDDASLSRVYFGEDDYMSVLDLYGLELNAEMVVLSACETGVGTMKRGEGVMSLARAFAYTGVPGITMSLWSVDDEAASKIMVYYYQHLKAGKPKDEALHAAKLDFLDNVEITRNQHPFYWAAFVHIGDAEALSGGWNGWWWLIGLFVVVLFILALSITSPLPQSTEDGH